MGPPRLGELLISKGYITEEQLAGALGEARSTNDLLGIVLLREELIFEDELARTLSEQLAIPYISVMRVGVNVHVARMLPSAVGKAAAAIPVREIGSTVQVAFADPTDPQALEAISRYLPKIEIALAVAELSDIRLAWRGVKDAPGVPA
jgi:type IV pilus assembly protein PilB